MIMQAKTSSHVLLNSRGLKHGTYHLHLRNEVVRLLQFVGRHHFKVSLHGIGSRTGVSFQVLVSFLRVARQILQLRLHVLDIGQNFVPEQIGKGLFRFRCGWKLGTN